MISDLRIHDVNDQPVREDGEFVLYWMIAARRTRFNPALEHAVAAARRLDKPLVVLEALSVDYRWTCDRFHRFILDGMADNAADLADSSARYYPYVEPEPGAGRGLLQALGERAVQIVTDEFPCFHHPRWVAAAGARAPVRMETVDGNGLLPLRAVDRTFPTAYAFRRTLQKSLRGHLDEAPAMNALSRVTLPPARLPREITQRWKPATAALLTAGSVAPLAGLPIDHTVAPVPERGGAHAARRSLKRFVDRSLAAYDEDAGQPEADGTSRLSPYLHFGHLSAHEVFRAVARSQSWDQDRLSSRTDGKRAGWWGMSPPAEAFLDQLVTWRELGYNMSFHRPDDHDAYESLPGWAQDTLDAHAGDPRDPAYTLDEFEAAATHDPLWNAAQTQLVREGHIHNYLRMLWGKKILEWSASPRDALAVMIELNNKYATDGRDPNSYSGIFWTLGRYDRPWAPERPVFGRIRYMSSDNTARKKRVRNYVERYTNPDLFAT